MFICTDGDLKISGAGYISLFEFLFFPCYEAMHKPLTFWVSEHISWLCFAWFVLLCFVHSLIGNVFSSMHVRITCFHVVALHHAVQLYLEISDLRHHSLSHLSKVVVTLAIEKGSHATEKRRCPRRELRVMRENWQRMCVLCVLDIFSSSPEYSLRSRIMKRRVTKQAPMLCVIIF